MVVDAAASLCDADQEFLRKFKGNYSKGMKGKGCQSLYLWLFHQRKARAVYPTPLTTLCTPLFECSSLFTRTTLRIKSCSAALVSVDGSETKRLITSGAERDFIQ